MVPVRQHKELGVFSVRCVFKHPVILSILSKMLTGVLRLKSVLLAGVAVIAISGGMTNNGVEARVERRDLTSSLFPSRHHLRIDVEVLPQPSKPLVHKQEVDLLQCLSAGLGTQQENKDDSDNIATDDPEPEIPSTLH